MTRFKTWIITEELNEKREEKLQDIWKSTLTALLGPLDPDTNLGISLSQITDKQSGSDNKVSTFKGKQAAIRLLNRYNVFNDLGKLQDPEIKQGIEDTKAWLGQQEPGHAANASTTISVLLQKLFGEKNYEKLSNKEATNKDDVKAKAPIQPPKDKLAPNGPSPDGQMPNDEMPDDQTQQPSTGQPPTGPTNSGMMGEQPPTGGNPQKPQTPMPTKPAGGIY
jgi:hypothetical protein